MAFNVQEDLGESFEKTYFTNMLKVFDGFLEGSSSFVPVFCPCWFNGPYQS